MSSKIIRKIYFCGSIRGGRDDAIIYKDIITQLGAYGEVLTEHVGDVETQEEELGNWVVDLLIILTCSFASLYAFFV